jgi:septation ring formation regulator EzrA
MENIELNTLPESIESVNENKDILANLVNRELASDQYIEQTNTMFRLDLEVSNWNEDISKQCADICNAYLA